MTYNSYKQGALRTANYPRELAMNYLRLGIRGEAGEVCDKIKKLIRDDGWTPGQPVPEARREAIILELGDVAWYAACIAHERMWDMAIGRSREDESVDLVFYDKTIHRSNELARYATVLNDIVAMDQLGSSSDRRHYTSKVLYWVGKVAACIDCPLSEVMGRNLAKLASRQERGRISGSGDYR